MVTNDKFELSGDHRDSTIYIKSTIIHFPNAPATGSSDGSHSFGDVFLSSTFQDFQDYREAISDKLNHLVGMYCPLVERIVSPHLRTVEFCISGVLHSKVYVGVFGHWYGWIPEGYDISITHIEFDKAVDLWGKHFSPPIVVFEPLPNSVAWKELKERADSLIDGCEYKDRHTNLITQFRQHYKNNGRIIQFFATKSELTERVSVFCAIHKGANLMAAARGEVSVEETKPKRQATAAQFGLLGRRKQISAVNDIFEELAFQPQVPALALVISGNRNAGQTELIHAILKNNQMKKGRPVREVKGRPPIENYGLKTLIQWVSEMLGLSSEKVIEGIDHLAENIHSELKKQQLALVIDRVDSFPGNIKTFYETFWKPLLIKLAEFRKVTPVEHRLIVILVDYSGDINSDDTYLREFNPDELSFECLIMLPKLTHITEKDLVRWFGEVQVSNPPSNNGNSNRHMDLARLILNNNEGIPTDVFDRLKGENLWPDDGENK